MADGVVRVEDLTRRDGRRCGGGGGGGGCGGGSGGRRRRRAVALRRQIVAVLPAGGAHLGFGRWVRVAIGVGAHQIIGAVITHAVAQSWSSSSSSNNNNNNNNKNE